MRLAHAIAKLAAHRTRQYAAVVFGPLIDWALDTQLDQHVCRWTELTKGEDE